MKRIKKLFLYWNTVKKLKPVQIKGQIARRLGGRQQPRQYIYRKKPASIHILIPQLIQDDAYLKRFDTEALMQGELLLLHERRRLTKEWKEPAASHLYNYNLHYLEFLIPLAAKYKTTGDEKYKANWAEIITSWMEHAVRSKDAYEPYTVSLRIPNILTGMELLGEAGGPLVHRIYESLYSQYRYLLSHQELALLANHYFENLKTIVISSILFQEPDIYQKYYKKFLDQTGEQILPDGMHYERSLMYHKIILEDILQVYTVLQSAGHIRDAGRLLPFVKAMAEALSLERGLHQTLLFNDAGDNVSKENAALLKACETFCGSIDCSRTEFPDAGYYRCDHGNFAVVFDCGDIGPAYMGGHAHNDCLSFELYDSGNPVFVNSGTGQYQGRLRSFFRSAPAHNTVMIDDREQSQLWGEHRAGKRISCIKASARTGILNGQFQNYLGDGFCRRMQWKGWSLLVTDDIRCKAGGYHTARQFFHLAPPYILKQEGSQVIICKSEELYARIRPAADSQFYIHTNGPMSVYAPDFGKYEQKQALEIRKVFAHHTRMCTEIKFERQAGE